MATTATQTPTLRLADGLQRGFKKVWEAPLLALLLLTTLVMVAIFAEALAPYDPTLPVRGAKIFLPPFWMQGGTMQTPLGTDFQGRDVLSRLIYGARVSLIVGLMGTLVAGGIGTAMGILSGYLGRWVDQVVMRLTDASSSWGWCTGPGTPASSGARS
jgi:peptide/nickel transport system permease protein